MMSVAKILSLSWAQISKTVLARVTDPDLATGPTSSQSRMRLFGQSESAIRVTLYRDHHAWCPYCQKIWLFLEEKKIPYKVRKVTMFCYGEKEAWYKKLVPSGMLPALELDGKMITESDTILQALEKAYGPLHAPMTDKQVYSLRKLERKLFNAWCRWLCYPSESKEQEDQSRINFIAHAKMVDSVLAETEGPFFLSSFSVADTVFIPYVERMNASLFYYKGFLLRDPEMFPNLSAWFDGIETRETYLGTQSDFHTHVHDLPPQMGGCFQNGSEEQKNCMERVDSCTDFSLPESGVQEGPDSKIVAAHRVLQFKEYIVKVNPCPDADMDEALRCVMTYLLQGDLVKPPPGSDSGLRYIKQRINVPRDLPIWSARRLREALELTAQLAGSGQPPPITEQHRRDQNPRNFGK